MICRRQARSKKFLIISDTNSLRLFPPHLVGADLLLFGRSPDLPTTLTDGHWPVNPEEELQDGFVGNTCYDNYRDGDRLEHVGVGWPERSVRSVTDPHRGTTHIRCNIQQEDSAGHHKRTDVLWFQLTKLKVRLAEVPQGNLDTTADSTDHEAQHGSVSPINVPPKQRQIQIERTRHIGLERALEVVCAGGDVQVQQTRTQDDTNERLPAHGDRGIDATNELRVVAICRHGILNFLLGGNGLLRSSDLVLPVLVECHIIQQY